MNRDPVDRIESAVTLDARIAPSSAHLDALLEGVMARVDAPHVIPLRRAPTSRWRAGLALVAAAATAAAAVAVTHARRTPPVHATIPHTTSSVRPTITAPAAEPAPAVPPSAPAVVAPTPATVPALRPSPAPAHPTAATMYRDANEARHQHDEVSAMRAYDRLIAAYPHARESVQARVTLGRMLLDRHERVARAASLAEDALAAGAQSSDAETAMVLRAQAYRALSRDADERRAWTALLARFPDSLQADTARARLDALR